MPKHTNKKEPNGSLSPALNNQRAGILNNQQAVALEGCGQLFCYAIKCYTLITLANNKPN